MLAKGCGRVDDAFRWVEGEAPHLTPRRRSAILDTLEALRPPSQSKPPAKLVDGEVRSNAAPTAGARLAGQRVSLCFLLLLWGTPTVAARSQMRSVIMGTGPWVAGRPPQPRSQLDTVGSSSDPASPSTAPDSPDMLHRGWEWLSGAATNASNAAAELWHKVCLCPQLG